MKKLFTSLMCVAALTQVAMASDAVQITGTFDLYNEPNKDLTGCDIGSQILLDNSELLGPTAIMSNFVEGQCDIYIPKNTRIFDLVLAATPCGSKVWVGTFEGRNGFRKIKITDHRSRLCKDLTVANVIVEETLEDGSLTTLYSQDWAVITPPEQGRICTQIAGKMLNPLTGECATYTNGCQRSELIFNGFTDTPFADECKVINN